MEAGMTRSPRPPGVSRVGSELQTTAGALTPHPVTGELLDLDAMSIEERAEVAGALRDHRARLAEFDDALNTVFLADLDRMAEWTVRVGDPTGRQWEIKSSSPTAGTETYPPDMLRDVLTTLVSGGVLSPEAASRAFKRRLTLELAVPWGADLTALADRVKGAIGIQIAGVEVEVISANPAEKAVASGITALRKIPGVSDALDEAKVTVPQGKRRVTVTLKTRASK
jgi:hypothetical protein